MADLVSIPTKKGFEVDLPKPQKNLISSLYSTADRPEYLTSAINEPLHVGDRLSTNLKDLFDELVPEAVQQAIVSCDVRKSEMTQSRIGQLREATQFLNSILASLNLPHALEDAQGTSDEVPQSLIEKSRHVADVGGLPGLNQMINEMPELVQRNKEILDETERMLREEEESDNQLRAQLKEKWTQTPSEKLNGTFKTNATRYREIINNALSADEVVRGKFNSHRQAIEVLGGGHLALSQFLPRDGSSMKAQGSHAARDALKQLMIQVETLRGEREVLEAQIKNVNFDLKTPFLNALAQDGAIDEPVMSTELIGHAFAPLERQVKDSLEKQESLIGAIQQNSDEYFGRRDSNDNASQRDQVMKQLAEGFDAFTDLKNNVREGTKFYNDLTQLLLAFQNKVSDFCFARKTTKEELLNDETSAAAAQPKIPLALLPPSFFTGTAPSSPPAYTAFKSKSAGRAVQIVTLEKVQRREARELRVDSLVLQELINATEDLPIAVVAIAGPARKGKSFILTYIVRYLQALEASENEDAGDWMGRDDPDTSMLGKGFEFKSGMDRTTDGIWMWSRPFIIRRNGESLAILVMDTEGCFDPYANDQEQSSIIGLSLLLSSCFIYNDSGLLNENTLTTLAKFMQYGQIASQNFEGKAFQRLMFLIRDWTTAGFDHGAGGGQGFIRRQFEANPRMSPQAFQIRRDIKEAFEDFNAYLMPYPGRHVVSDEFTGSVAEMKTDFGAHVENFIVNLIADVQPKRAANEQLVGKFFMKLFAHLVDSFNGDDMPSPIPLRQGIIYAALESRVQSLVTDYVTAFKQALGASQAPFYLEALLDNYHGKIARRICKFYRTMKDVGSAEDKRIFLGKLEQSLSSEYGRICQENTRNQQNFVGRCEEAAIAELKNYIESRILAASKIFDKSQYESLVAEQEQSAIQRFLVAVDQAPPEIIQSQKKVFQTKVQELKEHYWSIQELRKSQAEELVLGIITEAVQGYTSKLDLFTDDEEVIQSSKLKNLHLKQKSKLVEAYRLKAEQQFPDQEFILRFQQIFEEQLEAAFEPFFAKNNTQLEGIEKLIQMDLQDIVEAFKEEVTVLLEADPCSDNPEISKRLALILLTGSETIEGRGLPDLQRIAFYRQQLKANLDSTLKEVENSFLESTSSRQEKAESYLSGVKAQVLQVIEGFKADNELMEVDLVRSWIASVEAELCSSVQENIIQLIPQRFQKLLDHFKLFLENEKMLLIQHYESRKQSASFRGDGTSIISGLIVRDELVLYMVSKELQYFREDPNFFNLIRALLTHGSFRAQSEVLVYLRTQGLPGTRLDVMRFIRDLFYAGGTLQMTAIRYMPRAYDNFPDSRDRIFNVLTTLIKESKGMIQRIGFDSLKVIAVLLPLIKIQEIFQQLPRNMQLHFVLFLRNYIENIDNLNIALVQFVTVLAPQVEREEINTFLVPVITVMVNSSNDDMSYFGFSNLVKVAKSVLPPDQENVVVEVFIPFIQRAVFRPCLKGIMFPVMKALGQLIGKNKVLYSLMPLMVREVKEAIDNADIFRAGDMTANVEELLQFAASYGPNALEMTVLQEMQQQYRRALNEINKYGADRNWIAKPWVAAAVAKYQKHVGKVEM